MAGFTPFKREVYATGGKRLYVTSSGINSTGEVFVGTLEANDFLSSSETAILKMWKSVDPFTDAFTEVASVNIPFNDFMIMDDNVVGTDSKIHILITYDNASFSTYRTFYFQFNMETETWSETFTQLREDSDSHDGTAMPALINYRETSTEQLVVVYTTDASPLKTFQMRTRSDGDGSFSGETSLGITSSGFDSSRMQEALVLGPFNALYLIHEERGDYDPMIYTIFTDNVIDGPITYLGTANKDHPRQMGFVIEDDDTVYTYYGRETTEMLRGKPVGVDIEPITFLDRSGRYAKGTPEFDTSRGSSLFGEEILGLANDAHGLAVESSSIVYRRNTLDQGWSDIIILTDEAWEISRVVELGYPDTKREGMGVAYYERVASDDYSAWYMELPPDLTVPFSISFDNGGIGSSEEFGEIAGCAGVCPNGIPSGEEFGLIRHRIAENQFISLAGLGIASAEEFDPTFRFPLIYRAGDPIKPFSVPPSEEFGLTHIHFPTFFPISIPSAETFGPNHGIGTFDPNGSILIYHLDDRVIAGVIKFPDGNT